MQGEEKELDMILSDDRTEPNFIDLIINGEEYTVNVKELKRAVLALDIELTKNYGNNNNS